MPRLFAALLIALMIAANAAAHAFVVAPDGGPASQAPGDAIEAATTGTSHAQSIGSSATRQALQNGAMECTQSAASLNCAFPDVLPQRHAPPPDGRGRSMPAMAEESAPAGLYPSLLLRPPIPFS
jgi:hypothetical protein